jgi:hypothetical protein
MIEHPVEASFGALTNVQLVLAYRSPMVDIRLGDDVVWTLPRQVFSDGMAFPASVDGAHVQVVDELVVVDVWLPLPVRLAFELDDIEAFLDATLADDPEPVDPAELSVALVGAL